MDINITLLISIISVSFALYAGIRNLRRNESQDTISKAATQAKMESKLDSISEMIVEIKYDVANLHKETQKQNERIILIDNKANRAHERLDELRKQV